MCVCIYIYIYVLFYVQVAPGVPCWGRPNTEAPQNQQTKQIPGPQNINRGVHTHTQIRRQIHITKYTQYLCHTYVYAHNTQTYIYIYI